MKLKPGSNGAVTHLSCSFLALFTALGRQERIPRTLGASPVLPTHQREICSGQRQRQVGVKSSSSLVGGSVAQSSQARLPGGGGIGVRPRKMHLIWKGERDQIMFAVLLWEVNVSVLRLDISLSRIRFLLLIKSPGRQWKVEFPQEYEPSGRTELLSWRPCGPRESPSPAWRSPCCPRSPLTALGS